MLKEKLPRLKIFSTEINAIDKAAKKTNIITILETKICSLALMFLKKKFFITSLVIIALELK